MEDIIQSLVSAPLKAYIIIMAKFILANLIVMAPLLIMTAIFGGKERG